MGERISVLITDLDNTLWDWVAIWHASFSSLIDVLVQQGGLDRETLLDEAREIHQLHRTSEYALLLHELPSLTSLEDRDAAPLREAAIRASQGAREAVLALYPNVSESLEQIKAAGSLIVAYTESMAFQTKQRVRKLELDGVIDYLYSSEDHDFPEEMPPEAVRRYPDEHYELTRTEHRHVEKGVIKPSPKLLRQIMEDVDAKDSETAYVGDSKMKDISMAQQAGARDVWAAYGTAHDREEYELLRRVTHWSEEDVEREKALAKEGEVTPTHTLGNSFTEILDLFTFVPWERTHSG